MRAWAVVENGQPLKEIELPTPEPTGTEVLLEVTHCGVCHSDLHIWEGYYDVGGGQKMSLVDRGVTLPLAMGHEIVGRVVKLGPDAKGVKVGDLRIVFPWLGCGKCEKCLRRGRQHVHRRGAQPRRLPERRLRHPCRRPASRAIWSILGSSIPRSPRPMPAPASRSIRAIKKAMPLAPTQPIVLVGAGGLGLNAIAVLKALKHQNIISVDVSAEKREAALKAGAHKVGGRQRRRRGRDETHHRRRRRPGAAVIDLVNGTATARFAFGALAKGGKLIQVGLFGGELMLPLPIMAIRALTVQGSYVGNPKELRELVKLAQDGELSALPVATVPQSHANEALMRLRDGKVTGRLVLKAEAA